LIRGDIKVKSCRNDVPSADSRPLTVGDLFCGAGGFSEGFRQAGLVTKWAVELWKPATLTYQKSHPETTIFPRDILDLPDRILTPVDVIIGSPPCTQFSPANRGGNGDKSLGLSLAHCFFEIVSRLKPKYWILENVPALRFSLAKELEAGRVKTRKGELLIPRVSILNAAEFGVPQKRRRLFLGNFPAALPANSPVGHKRLTLGDVIQALPDPTQKPPSSGFVHDPNYPGLKFPVLNLRDHFEDTRWKLRPENIELARVAKEEHRWLGKMLFPDDRGKPSRTITGSHSTTSRSSIIFRYRNRGRNPFRTLTLREAATIQGFPVSYQFWHDSFGGKDHLVGNAVPPPVARGLAAAILREQGLPVPKTPLLFVSKEIPPPIAVAKGRANRFGPNRRFRLPVPIDVRHECRVELDNAGRVPTASPIPTGTQAKVWVTRLYLGYAKEYLCFEVSSEKVKDVLSGLGSDGLGEHDLRNRITRLVLEAHLSFDELLPSGTALQARWTERSFTGPRPESILRKVAGIVNHDFPFRQWREKRVPEPAYLRALGKPIEGGRNAPSKPVEALPVRVFGAAAALSIACDAINSGTVG
jgi:DNA (cytosine-5)-methyltransferase 1